MYGHPKWSYLYVRYRSVPPSPAISPFKQATVDILLPPSQPENNRQMYSFQEQEKNVYEKYDLKKLMVRI